MSEVTSVSGIIYSMNIGFNVKSRAIYVAIGEQANGAFQLLKIDRLLYQIEADEDIGSLFDKCETLIADLLSKFPDVRFGYLPSFAGSMGSGVETIKAEALMQLSIIRSNHVVRRITPQSLPKLLGAAKGVKWNEQISSLLNASQNWPYWNAGADGAAAVCYAINE